MVTTTTTTTSQFRAQRQTTQYRMLALLKQLNAGPLTAAANTALERRSFQQLHANTHTHPQAQKRCANFAKQRAAEAAHSNDALYMSCCCCCSRYCCYYKYRFALTALQLLAAYGLCAFATTLERQAFLFRFLVVVAALYCCCYSFSLYLPVTHLFYSFHFYRI